MSPVLAAQPAVVISGVKYPYDRGWSNQRLVPADGFLAFDTETEIVDLKQRGLLEDTLLRRFTYTSTAALTRLAIRPL